MPDKVGAYEGNENFAFVSYSHKDSEIVYPIIRELVRMGYRIWYDEGIPLISDYGGVLYDHIKNCGIFIVFKSYNSVESKDVEKEILHAISFRKRILQIVIDEDAVFTASVAYHLPPTIQHLKMSLEPEDFYGKLTLELKSCQIAKEQILTEGVVKNTSVTDRKEENINENETGQESLPTLSPDDEGEKNMSPVLSSDDEGEKNVSPVLSSDDEGEKNVSPVLSSDDEGEKNMSPALSSDDEGEKNMSPVLSSDDEGEKNVSPVLSSDDEGEKNVSPVLPSDTKSRPVTSVPSPGHTVQKKPSSVSSSDYVFRWPDHDNDNDDTIKSDVGQVKRNPEKNKARRWLIGAIIHTPFALLILIGILTLSKIFSNDIFFAVDYILFGSWSVALAVLLYYVYFKEKKKSASVSTTENAINPQTARDKKWGWLVAAVIQTVILLLFLPVLLIALFINAKELGSDFIPWIVIFDVIIPIELTALFYYLYFKKQ